MSDLVRNSLGRDEEVSPSVTATEDDYLRMWCSLGNGELPLNYRTEERFYERDVKKKVSPRPPKVLGS